jgi:hypothetical protein
MPLCIFDSFSLVPVSKRCCQVFRCNVSRLLVPFRIYHMHVLSEIHEILSALQCLIEAALCSNKSFEYRRTRVTTLHIFVQFGVQDAAYDYNAH